MEEKEKNTKQKNVSLRATEWIGTTGSLVVHTVLFTVAFALPFFGFPIDQILLVLTTVVSLEAIYLAIFIQMSVNRHNKNLEEVSKDIDEIQEDVEEITTDVDEVSKDIDEIQEDVDEISKDIDEIQEDVDEISKDIDEIQEDEEMEVHTKTTLEKIEQGIKQLSIEIEKLKAEGK